MYLCLYLSDLSHEQIEAIRAALRGQPMQPVGQALEITASRARGHVQAVALAMQRLGLSSVLASKACRERELVLAMVASRIVAPHTKLATTRWWHTTTLASDFGVADANEDDLYAAMDWLLARQGTIQKKLGTRHLAAGGLVLYDLSSSYFEGTTCPLAKLGYSRDGKPGLLQVNYGLLTDARGCPVAVSVYEGNVGDSTTFMPEVQRVREDFGIEQVVMVGVRGMIGHKAIAELRECDGVGWITALKNASILALVEQGQLQLGLFDQRNLVELNSPESMRFAPVGHQYLTCQSQFDLDQALLRLVLHGSVTDREPVGQRSLREPRLVLNRRTSTAPNGVANCDDSLLCTVKPCAG